VFLAVGDKVLLSEASLALLRNEKLLHSVALEMRSNTHLEEGFSRFTLCFCLIFFVPL